MLILVAGKKPSTIEIVGGAAKNTDSDNPISNFQGKDSKVGQVDFIELLLLVFCGTPSG